MRVLVIYCHPVAESFAAAAHTVVLDVATGHWRVSVPRWIDANRHISMKMANDPARLQYASMAVVHRRAREGVRAGWLSDHTRPFVVVLVEAAGQQDPPLGPFGHLGVACASREEVDQLYPEACREGRPTRTPTNFGDPVGYTGRIADPDFFSNSRLVRRSGLPWNWRRKNNIS